MKARLSKTSLTASLLLVLAITFTFNACSNDDGGGGGGDGNGNGGGNNLTIENTQVFNNDGTKYTGNGNIKMYTTAEVSGSCNGEVCVSYFDWYPSLSVGKVTNGIVELQLPAKEVINEYLEPFTTFYEGCEASPKDAKAFRGWFLLTDNNEKYIKDLSIAYPNEFVSVSYTYFSKAAKANCNVEDYKENYIIDIDAKEGWNKIYHRYYAEYIEISTNVPNGEAKWLFDDIGSDDSDPNDKCYNAFNVPGCDLPADWCEMYPTDGACEGLVEPSSSSGVTVVYSDKGNNISNYKTVTIGNQIWMAENLNYDVEGSKCYGEGSSDFTSSEVQANCDIYGRLYDWATAMALPSSCNENTCTSQVSAKHKGICPNGWHIPSENDWDELITAIGGSSTAGKHLKAAEGWNNSSSGLDSYGFAALPSGGGLPDGDFDGAGGSRYGESNSFWGSSERYTFDTYSVQMQDYTEVVYNYYFDKIYLRSVRCVMN
jgi:uncharacterized protein (TIGR02145 family)